MKPARGKKSGALQAPCEQRYELHDFDGVPMTAKSSRDRTLGRLLREREFDNLLLDQLYWHLLIERIMTQITDEIPDHMALLRVELQAD